MKAIKELSNHREISEKRISQLEDIARELRLKTVEMVWKIGTERKAHPGPALSIADIVTALYFEVMNIDANNPTWHQRDRFVLSKGHACPIVYAALAKLGYFDARHLDTLRHLDSILQGHPDMKKTPGIDFTVGSLGHGLSAGIGMAIAGKWIDKNNSYVYVVLGDGELQEGLIWEAAMSAGKYKLDNLIVIVDCNGWQSCGSVAETLDMEPLGAKWEAFGWKTQKINGHSIKEILSAIESAKLPNEKPTVILAETIKGKGVSYMENDNSWHQKAPTDEQMKIAEQELGK